MKRAHVLLGIVLMALLAAAPSRAQTSDETVKATFLYRFASFVTWPPASFSDPAAPIRLCVVGAEPFGRLLEHAVAGQGVDGRSFEVRRMSAITGVVGCNIVYAGGERADETLRAVRGLPVLTVTDASRGDARGMIHFVIVDDRVRFYIDDARAAESGLFLSSRLLALAVAVRRRAGA